MVNMDGDVQSETKLLDEGKVGARFRSLADAMLDVNGRQSYTERVTKVFVALVESKQQRHGVSSTGDGDADTIAGSDVIAAKGKGALRRHASSILVAKKHSQPPSDRETPDYLVYSVVMRVFVIIPAAGIGTRMAAGSHAVVPKQFLDIAGVPVLVRSVKAFLEVAAVDAVCLAVRGTERERVEALLRTFGLGPRVHLVEGGSNRQESVGNALSALECDDEDIVLVHDAVRPLIDTATVERMIDAVARHGAAIVGLPALDTIKQVERTADGAIITSTIPRERVVLAQTPQGANFALMQRAFAEAEADGFEGTDEASLLERAGVEVVVVPGSPRNFKITQPGDIELAEFYMAKAGAL